MAEPHEHADPSGDVEPGGAGRALALMLALFALALVLVAVRHRPPARRPADAPAVEFSGTRAREVLRRLVRHGRPHPVGSAADDQVREVIVGILTDLGYQPRIEEGFACHWGGACARVRNVVARLDGREPGAAVAMTAHYDSVDAGPGASDDLAGVAAILEIARALKAGPPPRHPVMVLIDEGEESGLIGATAFEEAAPERADVKAVVNLEARGTRGPSFMFETSGDDAWMIRAWAPRVPRPVTTSLAAAIYAQLPNDTDLTVFRHHHVPGLNFAFIGGAAEYHTAYDDFEDSSPASLQHQGDNALAAVTGLADAAELANPPAGRLAYFDVMGLGIARWPLGWSLGMAVAALLLLLASTVAALRRRALTGGDLVLGLLAAPAMLLGTALLAFVLALALRMSGALAVNWLAYPLPAETAFCMLALTVVAALAPMLGRRAAPLGLWAGIWIVWAALGLALALLAPATSYVFVLPALIAGACGALGRVWRVPEEPSATAAASAGPAGRDGGGARSAMRAMRAAIIVPGVAAAVIWFGVLPPIADGLGAPALWIVATLAAILFSSLAPLISGGGRLGARLWQLALALTVVAALLAMAHPRFTRQSPQPLTFTFHQPAPALPAGAAVAPDLQVLESSVAGGKRHLRLHLVSRRGAMIATLWVPGAAHPESVTVEGHRVPDGGWRVGRPRVGPSDWLRYSDLTLPAAGCDLDLVLGDAGPLELYATDVTPGLPPSGAALLAARPVTAAPFQEGDATVVSRKVKIGGGAGAAG